MPNAQVSQIYGFVDVKNKEKLLDYYFVEKAYSVFNVGKRYEECGDGVKGCETIQEIGNKEVMHALLRKRMALNTFQPDAVRR